MLNLLILCALGEFEDKSKVVFSIVYYSMQGPVFIGSGMHFSSSFVIRCSSLFGTRDGKRHFCGENNHELDENEGFDSYHILITLLDIGTFKVAEYKYISFRILHLARFISSLGSIRYCNLYSMRCSHMIR